MDKSPVTLTVEQDNLPALRTRLAGLLGAKVCVGIPEENTARKGEPINNAQLLYIHTNGSEVNNIPPRPVIEPAILDAKEQIVDTLEKAADAQLEGETSNCNRLMALAGQQGANAAKRWFTNPSNGWARNKLATIARKLSKLRGKAKTDAMQVLTDAGETGDVSSIDTPLIDTGEMRRAITYVQDEIS
jgi:hypothetical protein